MKHTGWKGHFKVDIDPHPLLIILMMWKNRKSVNLHKRAKMVTSETAVLYIGYKHEEFIDILFLKSKKKKKKKFIAEFYNWKFTVTTLIKKMPIKILIATDMNKVQICWKCKIEFMSMLQFMLNAEEFVKKKLIFNAAWILTNQIHKKKAHKGLYNWIILI